MKKIRYLLVIAAVFIILFFVFYRTANLKYLFLGIGLVPLGIATKMYDIKHPGDPGVDRIFLTGTIAWIAWIIIGIFFIFSCSYDIITTGIW